MDGVIVALRAVGGFLARVADGLCDGLVLGIRRISFLPPLSRAAARAGGQPLHLCVRTLLRRRKRVHHPAVPSAALRLYPLRERVRRRFGGGRHPVQAPHPAPSASACSCSAWGCLLRWRTCCGCNGNLRPPAALCRRAFFFRLDSTKKAPPPKRGRFLNLSTGCCGCARSTSRQYTGRSPLGWKGTWVVQPQPSQITSKYWRSARPGFSRLRRAARHSWQRVGSFWKPLSAKNCCLRSAEHKFLATVTAYQSLVFKHGWIPSTFWFVLSRICFESLAWFPCFRTNSKERNLNHIT